jgi:ubiquinone/menaquinone biosynthesis C-methylase UbiE
MKTIQTQYDDIAFIYDLLSEGDDGVLYFRMNIEKLTARLSPLAKILDCSCGTGDHAIWLSRQGFNVHASDISPGMIEEAAKKAARAGVLINFFESSWEELPQNTDDIYDLVVCPGNSMSHINDLSNLGPTFKAIRKILKPGGRFFFDIRNWEKTFSEASLTTQDFQVEGVNGLIDVHYSYEINGWNVPCTMNVDVRRPGESEYTCYPFHFFPISYEQMRDAMMAAGFEKVERDYYPGEDYYFAIAK